MRTCPTSVEVRGSDHSEGEAGATSDGPLDSGGPDCEAPTPLPQVPAVQPPHRQEKAGPEWQRKVVPGPSSPGQGPTAVLLLSVGHPGACCAPTGLVPWALCSGGRPLRIPPTPSLAHPLAMRLFRFHHPCPSAATALDSGAGTSGAGEVVLWQSSRGQLHSAALGRWISLRQRGCRPVILWLRPLAPEAHDSVA